MGKIISTNFKRLFGLFVNCVAFWAFWDITRIIGKWYLEETPTLGVKTLLSAVYLNYIIKWNEFIGPLGWKYIWYGGNPLSLDHPSLYFVLMVPFTTIWGIVGSVMHFAIFSLFLFALFSYLVFEQLAKNKILALFLTIALLLSSNLYISLVRYGDIPSWITQAFLPLVVFLIVKFLQEGNRRFLVAAALFSGFFALGYPQGFIYSIVPFSIVLLMFYNPLGVKTWSRFLNSLWFLAMFFLVSLPVVFNLIATPNELVSRLYTPKVNYEFWADQFIIWLFLASVCVIWAAFLVYKKSFRRYAFGVLPFALFLAVGVIFADKFPYAIPFAACLLVVVLFSQLTVLFGKFDFLKKREPFAFVTVNIILLIFIFVYFPQAKIMNLVTKLDSMSTTAPMLFVDKSYLGDSKEKNKRIYSVNPAINLSLALSTDIPLAGGLVESALGPFEKWGFAWLESVFVTEPAVLSKIIDQNAKFLLDWNAIYYVVRPYAAKDTEGVFFEKREGGNDLSYFKVKEEFTSPILTPSNASAILHIGDLSAYDTIYRFLGMRNLNSKKIVVANNSKYIDEYSLSDLKKFDAVILYRYDYHNRSKAWELVEKYLKDGGMVYIDTGPDGHESKSDSLPDFFPIKRMVREDIGVLWDVEVLDAKLGENVDFNSFSPLDFDGEAWNVSHPRDDHDLNPGARVILKNNDIIVSASSDVGSGKLIWTGFNLPYHIIRDYNEEESDFFVNLISSLVDTSEKVVSNVDYKWISPEHREVTVGGSRAVLFKEQDFGGWRAVSNSNDKLKIYRTGPVSPGFMYVPFEKEKIPQLVTFSYRGQLKFWILGIISIMTLVFLSFKLIQGR